MKIESGISKKTSIHELYQKFGVLAILIIEIAIFSLLSDRFFSLDNLFTVGRQITFTGIATVGCTLLMLTGGIDLSTGSILAFSGVICTYMMTELGVPIWLSIIAALALGILAGGISGFAFTKLKISSLIATLAMQYILRGIAFLITNAKAVYGLSETYKFLGQGYLFGFFPFPLLIFIVVFLFGLWLLNFSYIGRYIYAVGGNPEAARLSGIKINRIYMLVFVFSSFFAAIAGVLMAARMGSGQPSIGVDFPMDVITAIVLGGVSISGGSGKITGVILGVFIMGILGNGMVMLNVSDYVQWVVKGIVLLLAVAMSNIDTIINSKKGTL